eukprot:CAMPEP_0177675482 /NCGR_PEP_ID=MMETSP0447-20121125/27217_1 /TAXON_ID=0 /ORGANISM="Stygamoeba regulata, Strain BSH-02190019" /LENGTH=409 /DNA_ID=CAMNT_0019183857 /DNA_START=119 /DNA_END=1348 /DNA_ORIENTATION=-
MRSLSDESVTTRPSLPLDDLPSTESLRRRNAEEDYTPDRVHFVRSDPNASVQNHSSSPRDQTSAELLKSTHGDEVFYFYACVEAAKYWERAENIVDISHSQQQVRVEPPIEVVISPVWKLPLDAGSIKKSRRRVNDLTWTFPCTPPAGEWLPSASSPSRSHESLCSSPTLARRGPIGRVSGSRSHSSVSETLLHNHCSPGAAEHPLLATQQTSRPCRAVHPLSARSTSSVASSGLTSLALTPLALSVQQNDKAGHNDKAGSEASRSLSPERALSGRQDPGKRAAVSVSPPGRPTRRFTLRRKRSSTQNLHTAAAAASDATLSSSRTTPADPNLSVSPARFSAGSLFSIRRRGPRHQSMDATIGSELAAAATDCSSSSSGTSASVVLSTQLTRTTKTRKSFTQKKKLISK